ncbi:hypothetical protein R1sor_019435 [Riccia sorocarpa]|uniref:Uncharacterized protein n=1 Tax=Riccia sorocarpa TaxID=122646 RepID=A0ABD3ICJ5_9MARC
MCQSYTTQRVQRPNLKAVIINAFQAKPVGAAENAPPTTPGALSTLANATPSTATDPQNTPRTPATATQKPRSPGTYVESECSVIPAWKLFAAAQNSRQTNFAVLLFD